MTQVNFEVDHDVAATKEANNTLEQDEKTKQRLTKIEYMKELARLAASLQLEVVPTAKEKK